MHVIELNCSHQDLIVSFNIGFRVLLIIHYFDIVLNFFSHLVYILSQNLLYEPLLILH